MSRHIKSGFTLIEIMVVVGILLILISLTIPNILRSRSVANEAAARANLKTLSDSCHLYHSNRGTFPAALEDLASPNSNPPYIDSALGSGKKQGYTFMYTSVSGVLGFSINATPDGVLKGRYYYIDESGITRFRIDGDAGPEDTVVE